MQIIKYKNIEKRIMYYWSKLYANEIKDGDNYNNLNKTIVILIANFELDVAKDIPKIHTKWEIREEEFSKKVLTDVLEINIIELPKLIKAMENNEIDKKDKLTLWLTFLLSPEKIGDEEMKENADIEKAKNELEKINQDEREKELARLRMKHIMDQQAIKDYAFDEGFDEGKEAGIKEGIKEGIIQGTKKEKIQTAKKLIKAGMTIEQIIEITELTEEEIKRIDKE